MPGVARSCLPRAGRPRARQKPTPSCADTVAASRPGEAGRARGLNGGAGITDGDHAPVPKSGPFGDRSVRSRWDRLAVVPLGPALRVKKWSIWDHSAVHSVGIKPLICQSICQILATTGLYYYSFSYYSFSCYSFSVAI